MLNFIYIHKNGANLNVLKFYIYIKKWQPTPSQLQSQSKAKGQLTNCGYGLAATR